MIPQLAQLLARYNVRTVDPTDEVVEPVAPPIPSPPKPKPAARKPQPRKVRK